MTSKEYNGGKVTIEIPEPKNLDMRVDANILYYSHLTAGARSEFTQFERDKYISIKCRDDEEDLRLKLCKALLNKVSCITRLRRDSRFFFLYFLVLLRFILF